MNEERKEECLVYAFFPLSIELASANMLLSETSVEAAPFTDTHSQFSRVWEETKLCEQAPSPVGCGIILAERVEGKSKLFPKFTL